MIKTGFFRQTWHKFLTGSEILDTISKYSILAVAIIFIYTYPETAKKNNENLILQSWQILNSSSGKGGNGGTNTALATLVSLKQSLKGINLDKVYIDSLQLKNADFERASFKDAILVKSKFINSNFTHTDFTNSILRENDFSKSNFSSFAKRTDGNITYIDKGISTKFMNIDASKSIFKDCDLSGIKFKNVKFRNSNFEGANLTYTNLSNLKLGGTIFKGANLKDVNLTNADFRIFEGNMRTVSFENAKLYRTNFSGSNLSDKPAGLLLVVSSMGTNKNKKLNIPSGVNFSGAIISGANFSNSKLDGANFTNVVYNNTEFWGEINFSSTSLLNITGLTQSLLNHSCGNKDTLIPEAYNIKTCKLPEKKSSKLLIDTDDTISMEIKI